MKNENMTEIIYDYFASRIQFGYYAAGDLLPSISYIRRQFQISALTVRAALARLKEEGYIETRERMPAVVIYQSDGQINRQYVLSFLSRKDGMDDMYHFSGTIFGPAAKFYLQKQDRASIDRLRSQLKKMNIPPAKQIIRFYAEAIRVLNNPLMLNLYWEVVRYLRIPYLRQPADFDIINSQAANHLERMLALIQEGNSGGAADEMLEFNSRIMHLFLQKLHTAFDDYLPVEQFPFRWQIYREHPQLCYTLAARIMGRISSQAYRPGELLPSCQMMAREFGVSHITMRRTLELLNDMRSIETINGVGTRIAPRNNSALPNFAHPQIRKSMLLSLHAMQLSALTCQNVATNTLSHMDSSSFRPLTEQLRKYREERVVHLTAVACLRFVGINSPSAFIREVYDQLYHLLLWANALRPFIQKSDVRHTCEAHTAGLLEKLENRDINGFASTLSGLFFTMETFTRELFQSLGLETPN